MRRQRNTSQMKEKHKTTTKGVNEMKLSTMPDKQFKVMAIKILTRLEKRVEDFSETLSKEIQNIKKKPEMNNSLIKIKIH